MSLVTKSLVALRGALSRTRMAGEPPRRGKNHPQAVQCERLWQLGMATLAFDILRSLPLGIHFFALDDSWGILSYLVYHMAGDCFIA